MSSPLRLHASTVIACLLFGCVTLASAATADKTAFSARGKAAASSLPAYAKPGSGVTGRFDPSALDEPSIALSLPGGQVIVARQVNIRRTGTATTWHGKIADARGEALTLTNFRGVVTGSFTYLGTAYEIVPAAGGNHVLYAVDPTRRPPREPPVLPTVPDIGARQKNTGSIGRLAADQAPVVQDLLVVYTATAGVRMGGPGASTSRVLNAAAFANQAYVNSQVGITLNVVGVRQTDLVEGASMEDTLDAMKTSESIAAMREETGADLVVLVAYHTDYCGIAWLLNGNDRRLADMPHAVVASDCISDDTLAHEVGHLQGLDHDHTQSPVSGGVFPYGTGFAHCPGSGDDFRDIMSYGCASSFATPLQQFSNPALSYAGIPTGVYYDVNPADAAEGSRALNEIAPLIADYRPGKGITTYAPPAAPTGLVATAVGAYSVSLGWNDNSSDEYSFAIFRAAQGQPFYEVASVPPNSVTFEDRVGPNGTWRYKVRAYNSNGLSLDSNVIEVTTLPPPPPPAAPVDLVAVSNEPNSVSLTWTDASTDETQFVVGRLVPGGTDWLQIAYLPADATSYVDHGVPGGSDQSYRVWAANLHGSSSSAVASVRVRIDPVLEAVAPSSVSATLTAKRSIAVNWPATANSVGYDVRREIWMKNVTKVRVGNKTKKQVHWDWYGSVVGYAETPGFVDTVSSKGKYRYSVRARSPSFVSAFVASAPVTVKK